MTKYVKRKVERQWLIHSSLLTTFGVASPGYQGLIADVLNAVIFPARLLRILGRVKLDCVDLQTDNGSFLVLGLIRVRQGSSPCPSPMDVNDADSGWLYRQVFGLPNLAMPVSGLVQMEGDNYNIDWQIYGGKGVEIDRDQELRLVCACNPLAGAVNVSYWFNTLYEAS